MLHSIATGNMLPSWVKIVCVDINPAVATKVSDRGTGQAVGVVTDVGLFLELLSRELGRMSMNADIRTSTRARASTRRCPRSKPGRISFRITRLRSPFPSSLRLSEDRLARFRHHHDPLCAGQALPRAEVAQDVYARLSRSRDLSGKRGELLPARYREGVPAGARSPSPVSSHRAAD